MATQNGVSKSQAIRDTLAANPTATVADIVAKLAEVGIKVSKNLVYTIKAKSKAKGQPKASRMVPVAASNRPSDPVALILDVKRTAERLGGMKTLKSLVDILA